MDEQQQQPPFQYPTMNLGSAVSHAPNAPPPPFTPPSHPIYPPLSNHISAPTNHQIITPTPVAQPVPQWLPGTEGSVPAGAVAGGRDINGEPLYVARARYGGALIPGKVIISFSVSVINLIYLLFQLVASHRGCYVAWGGKENLVKHYEVLCNYEGEWIPSRKDEIPAKAIDGGHTETGEKLFIGRASHKKLNTPGKVQPSHKCCYISFSGREVAYKSYEILVAK